MGRRCMVASQKQVVGRAGGGKGRNRGGDLAGTRAEARAQPNAESMRHKENIIKDLK